MRTWFYENDNFSPFIGTIKGILIFALLFCIHVSAAESPCEPWLKRQQVRLADGGRAMDGWDLRASWNFPGARFGSRVRTGTLNDKVRALTIDLLDQKMGQLGERSRSAVYVAYDPPGVSEDDMDVTREMNKQALDELDKLLKELGDDDTNLDDEDAEWEFKTPEPDPAIVRIAERAIQKYYEVITTSWLYSRPNEEDLKFQCPSYHTIRNKVHFHIESENLHSWSAAESFAYIHEMEHALQTHQRIWNSKFIPDFVKRMRHKFEVFRVQFERDLAEYWRGAAPSVLRNIAGYLISKEEIPAIGAQWELASRIPKEFREEIIKGLEKEIDEIRRGDSSYARGSESSEKQLRLKTAVQIRMIAIESLKRADLNKHDFIMQMLPVHGYDVKSFTERLR